MVWFDSRHHTWGLKGGMKALHLNVWTWMKQKSRKRCSIEALAALNIGITNVEPWHFHAFPLLISRSFSWHGSELSQRRSWAVCTSWILYKVTRPFWISWSPGAHFYPASTPQTPRGTALSAMESNLTNVYFASISWSQQVCWTVLTKYSEQRRLMKLCPANFCWFFGWSGVFLVKIQHLNDANVIVIAHFSLRFSHFHHKI